MSNHPLRDNAFRANVGAAIVSPSGLVLALERIDIPGSWQLPQGGLNEGEEPMAAVHREIQEETGIPTRALELIDEYPEWLAYELPIEKRSSKTGRGQVQKWFLFRFLGQESDIILDISCDREFGRWAWARMDDLRNRTAPFRQNIYSKLAERFRPQLK